MRSGWSSGSIYSVLLVSGRFCLSKTIIPEAQEHFLTPLARRDTHPFGGLGLRTNRRAIPLGPSLLGFTGDRPVVASKVAPLVLAIVYGP